MFYKSLASGRTRHVVFSPAQTTSLFACEFRIILIYLFHGMFFFLVDYVFAPGL